MPPSTIHFAITEVVNSSRKDMFAVTRDGASQAGRCQCKKPSSIQDGVSLVLNDSAKVQKPFCSVSAPVVRLIDGYMLPPSRFAVAFADSSSLIVLTRRLLGLGKIDYKR